MHCLGHVGQQHLLELLYSKFCIALLYLVKHRNTQKNLRMEHLGQGKRIIAQDEGGCCCSSFGRLERRQDKRTTTTTTMKDDDGDRDDDDHNHQNHNNHQDDNHHLLRGAPTE